MTNDCFDEAFDRYLAGRPVPAQAAALVAFADGVRAVAARAGRPSPQLSQLLAGGLVGASDTAVVGVVPVLRSAQPGGHRRRKRTVLGALTGAAARLVPAGALAQAALGVGAVLTGVTGAAAAGVLPAAVQHEVSTVIESVTPFELPNSGDDTSSGDEEPATQVGVVPGTENVQDGGSPAGAPAQAEFGRRVSEHARTGGVDGQDISDQARGSHGPRVPAVPAPQQPATERPAPAKPAPGQNAAGEPASSSGSPTLPGSPGNQEPGRP